jgi:hypothetical protein
VMFASEGRSGRLLDRQSIEAGIALWEPEEHASLELYRKGTLDEVSAPGDTPESEILELHPHGEQPPKSSSSS